MKEVGRPRRRSKAAVLEALKETLGTVKLTHLNRERLTHGLQSLKLIHPGDHHDPDLYGAVTIEGVLRLEVDATRWKIFCMAITATDRLDRGRQSPKSSIFVKEGYGDVAMRTARRSSEIYTLIFD